ncbi:CRISPR-associated helicase Cas3' [uncultured Lamprocystis sp.]|jgi:CRISPR-associated endonuclease/helicase Cas3|uniref:CRISPR-associated helicase Cas3' n=2 Tax=uncultured Lamprocystis sp. TaxID=543132 RepID=UPI003413349C
MQKDAVMGSHAEFWGKLRQDHLTGRVLARLSLVEHCLDVAGVFTVLVRLPLIRARLDAAAGRCLTEADLDRLGVLALLHDLGKTNLGFQDKPFDPRSRVGHIAPIQALYGEDDLCERLIAALTDLCEWADPPEVLESFLLAAWSHHGTPVRFDSTIRTGYDPKWWRPRDGRDPFAGIAELLHAARQTYPRAFAPDLVPLPDQPALQHRFAGLVMLADWLGSHDSFFPIDRAADFDRPRAARQAVRGVGLDAGAARLDLAGRPADFTHRFGFTPHPLQASIDALPPADPVHRLLVAEAETGSGKTEAALARFFHLFAAGAVDALYFALPTRVAARELYRRIRRYLRRAFPDPRVRPRAVLAVPRYARVGGIPVEKLLPPPGVRWDEDASQRRAERVWAAEHPKRFLAATVAVGTIDQALLSAVQTRHSHLRSVCLDRSLLVVDEVHASDPYMRYLLKGLLGHHLGLGGHALLLSATLGAAARTELVAAAAGVALAPPPLAAALAAPYPALTDLSGEPLRIAPVPAPGKPVRFSVRPLLDQPQALIPELAEALTAGARVLAVFNTVGRAVAFQRACEADPAIPAAALFRCAGVICPHHGRFAPTDREWLDQAVSARLGKGSAPGPLLLIGTQTLEQSLDLDADLLITDLCPADVLLQRVGRLHRHARERPAGFVQARCLVLVPDTATLEDLLDGRGTANRTAKSAGLGSVYEDLRTLELTRRMLAETPLVEIPADNRRLVEGATHPERLALLVGERWARHAVQVDGETLAKERAGFFVAAKYDKAFADENSPRPDDLPYWAATRLGLGTLRIPLSGSPLGPFGRPCPEITIPGHLLPGVTADETPTDLTPDPDGFRFTLAGVAFRYTRFGLEKEPDEPAH